MQLTRAVVAQGVMYRVNKPAKEWFDAGVYMNTMEDPAKCLGTLHDTISKIRQQAFQSLIGTNDIVNLRY